MAVDKGVLGGAEAPPQYFSLAQAPHRCSSVRRSAHSPMALIPTCILANNKTDARDLKQIANEFVAIDSSLQNIFGNLRKYFCILRQIVWQNTI